jgi:hypothetical protein
MIPALMTSMMPWIRDLLWWLLDTAYITIGVEG